MQSLRGQIPLGVQRGHAASSRAGNGLAVYTVGGIAGVLSCGARCQTSTAIKDLKRKTDTAAPGTVWVPVLATTKVRFKVSDLTPYKAYWFAVQALGTDGPGAMSDPIIGRAA